MLNVCQPLCHQFGHDLLSPQNNLSPRLKVQDAEVFLRHRLKRRKVILWTEHGNFSPLQCVFANLISFCPSTILDQSKKKEKCNKRKYFLDKKTAIAGQTRIWVWKLALLSLCLQLIMCPGHMPVGTCCALPHRVSEEWVGSMAVLNRTAIEDLHTVLTLRLYWISVMFSSAEVPLVLRPFRSFINSCIWICGKRKSASSLSKSISVLPSMPLEVDQHKGHDYTFIICLWRFSFTQVTLTWSKMSSGNWTLVILKTFSSSPRGTSVLKMAREFQVFNHQEQVWFKNIFKITRKSLLALSCSNYRYFYYSLWM